MTIFRLAMTTAAGMSLVMISLLLMEIATWQTQTYPEAGADSPSDRSQTAETAPVLATAEEIAPQHSVPSKDSPEAAPDLAYRTWEFVDRYAERQPTVSSQWIASDSTESPAEPTQAARTEDTISQPEPHVDLPASPAPSPEPQQPDSTDYNGVPLNVENGVRAMAMVKPEYRRLERDVEETSSVKGRKEKAPKAGFSVKKASKGQPGASPKAGRGSYSAAVWSRLKRQKPANTASGGATVSFAIGQDGRLRGARIVRSSGNAQVDKAALSTVRRAAPFPKPPTGSAVYAIQIGAR